MKTAYPIVLTPAEGGYVVSVPDLDINTEGDSIADAIFMAEDAIGLCGLALEDINQPIPDPGSVPFTCEPGDLTAFAVVDFGAVRRTSRVKSIRKNVTIPSWLNEKAEQANLNFSQILQSGLKTALNLL